MKVEKKVILIFGKRGSGKSYLANKLVENEPRLFIYDTLGEYTNGAVIDMRPLLAEYLKSVYRGKFRIVYRPLIPKRDIDPICEILFKIGNVTLLIEEIDTFCTPFNLTEQFAAIIQRGRHKNIQLVGITQRPYAIHPLLRSQAKIVYCFSMSEPRDLAYIREFVRDPGIEDKIQTLPEYHYVFWCDGKPEIEIGKK